MGKEPTEHQETKRMRKGLENELKVGIFVALGLALTMVAIIVLGGSDNLLERKNVYVVHFDDANGLIPGSKVVIGGVQVGAIDAVEYDPKRRDIQVTLQIAKDQADWVRKDSEIEVLTQGMLGDKYLAITRGSADQPELESGAELTYKASQGLGEFISKSDQLLVSLQSIAGSVDRIVKGFESGKKSEIIFQGLATTSKNLSEATTRLNAEIQELQLKKLSKNMNAIIEKVNNGQGTLGALVNDPGLYDDVKSLVGGANRNRVVRNLVRQTIRNNDTEQAAEDKK